MSHLSGQGDNTMLQKSMCCHFARDTSAQASQAANVISIMGEQGRKTDANSQRDNTGSGNTGCVHDTITHPVCNNTCFQLFVQCCWGWQEQTNQGCSKRGGVGSSTRSDHKIFRKCHFARIPATEVASILLTAVLQSLCRVTKAR